MSNVSLSLKTKILNGIRNIFKWEPLEVWLQRNTVNKPLSSIWGKLPANHYQYSPQSFRKVCVNGIWYQLDISNFNDWSVYFGLKEEQRERLLGLVEEGNYVIDVGANIGAVSLPFAKIVGKEGKVISLEPHPVTHQKLLNNLSLNDFPQLIPLQKGLGDTTTTFTISTIDAHNPGRNRILPENQNDEYEILENHEIEVDTLDKVVADLNLQRVDLIKIDVEGFEMKVLEGGKFVLEELSPHLFIELDDSHLQAQGSSAKELVAFLEGFKYLVWKASNMESIDSSMDFTNCHFDIVAKKSIAGMKNHWINSCDFSTEFILRKKDS
ncbi:MAG: FkbM family methyltransferase [Chitinophagales bacterium]